VPQFVASLQPSLPRCDLEAGQLRFFLLPQDSGADAISVVFKVGRATSTVICAQFLEFGDKRTKRLVALCRAIAVSWSGAW
jgi:hypothetical protein